MSVSSVDIANSALVKVGAETILSLDDDSKEAQVCKVRYNLVRQIVLRMHPWNCAIKRATTSALTAAPAFGYSYQHQLPADCLRALEVDVQDDPEYRIEGRRLHTDSNEVELKYLYDLEDTSEMDALLTETIAAYLAFDIAYTLTQNGNVRDSMFGLFEAALRRAKTIDAQEDSRMELEANHWDESRISTRIDRSGR